MNIQDRSMYNVSTKLFANNPLPELVCDLSKVDIKAPEDQYILRMCIQHNGEWLGLPPELQWLKYMLIQTNFDQYNKGIRHPFIYITVRNGTVKSKTDDQWHLDGFSTRIEHTPEQNYIFTNDYCTEYVDQSVDCPEDLDPLVYNMNTYLDKFVKPENIRQCEPNKIYCLDPYVLHRRPSNIPEDFKRVFVRISYVPIEIDDINNTQNPFKYINYTKDGVKFRDSLKHYLK